jgi:hypothetical protein
MVLKSRYSLWVVSRDKTRSLKSARFGGDIAAEAVLVSDALMLVVGRGGRKRGIGRGDEG